MASTPEGKVKAKVKAMLKAHGAYVMMPVQNGMGTPAIDFYVCHHGLFLGIETKAPGKKATARQQSTMREIVAAGGTALLIDDDGVTPRSGSVGTSLRRLEQWLENAQCLSLLVKR